MVLAGSGYGSTSSSFPRQFHGSDCFSSTEVKWLLPCTTKFHGSYISFHGSNYLLPWNNLVCRVLGVGWTGSSGHVGVGGFGFAYRMRLGGVCVWCLECAFRGAARRWCGRTFFCASPKRGQPVEGTHSSEVNVNCHGIRSLFAWRFCFALRGDVVRWPL